MLSIFWKWMKAFIAASAVEAFEVPVSVMNMRNPYYFITGCTFVCTNLEF